MVGKLGYLHQGRMITMQLYDGHWLAKLLPPPSSGGAESRVSVKNPVGQLELLLLPETVSESCSGFRHRTLLLQDFGPYVPVVPEELLRVLAYGFPFQHRERQQLLFQRECRECHRPTSLHVACRGRRGIQDKLHNTYRSSPHS